MRYVILILLLCSCGAQRDLAKAKKLINRAIIKGAKVETDTVMASVTFKAPAISFETTITNPNWNDTLIIIQPGKDSIVTRIKRIPGVKGKPEVVYVKTDCPEKEITKEVPVAINQNISAGYSLWQLIILAIVSYLVGGVTFPWILKQIR